MNEDQKTTTAGAFLVTALMSVNFLNFIFNALLGRFLPLHDYALLTLINTLYYLLMIVLSGIISSTNHQVSFLQGKNKVKTSFAFFHETRWRVLSVAFLSSLIFAAGSPMLMTYFNESSVVPFLLLSPAIIFGTLMAVNRGFLTGIMSFKKVGVIVISEGVIKLVTALAFVLLGWHEYTYIAVPISITFTSLLSLYLISQTKDSTTNDAVGRYIFPKQFFIASLITGLSANAFLSFDVLLAKHFLTPTAAGQYALLSLVGKMIFFFGSLLSAFTVTVVSRNEGQGKNPKYVFYKIFAGTAFLVVNGVALLGFMGPFFVPMLLGEKASALAPFLNRYTLAIGLFTLTHTIVLYRLARKQFIFPIFSFLAAILMSIGLSLFHKTINDFTNVILFAAFVNFLVICILNFLVDEGRFISRSFVDFIDLFFPLPPGEPIAEGKKRILVFNWRDTKHKDAGGAEVYIHELSKHWIEDGHRVTQFSGNDGHSKRYERVDGVEVIRRGGFYFVYLWAPLYYLIKFRGKYDVVIDCQNGIPFFTPLFAKEPVYCVMHHVHQEIFQEFLPKPLAIIASFLEAEFMPWAYKSVQFIAVSESTKEEMETLGIKGKGIDIVYNGVDVSKLQPGSEDKQPIVLYLGRLKAYKSVHHLIHAFEAVLGSVPKAQLVIAGTGEEEARLRKVAEKLGLDAKIRFVGKVSEKEKLEWLQKAWVFVNPSRKEGWGITTIEANACGTPVVASDVPGLRESVNNPHTGYLVPYGDIENLADRIIEILSNNELRGQMVKNSHKWAHGFSWKASAEKFIKML